MGETVKLSPEDIEAIDAGNVEGEAAPNVVVAPEDVDAVFAGDVGPTARRARRGGTPSKPREYTDEELGLNTGPLKDVIPNPGLNIKLPGGFETNLILGGGEGGGYTETAGGGSYTQRDANGKPRTVLPQTAAEAERANKFVEGANAGQAGAALARNVAGIIAAGPLEKGVSALAEGAGAAPKLAEILGGVAAGAGQAVAAGEGPKEVAVAGAVGGGVSGLMEFVANRISASVAQRQLKTLARKGSEPQQAAIVENGVKESADVMKRYGISGINNPKNAHGAVRAAIAQAEQARDEAAESIKELGGHAEDLLEEVAKGGEGGVSEPKGTQAERQVFNEARKRLLNAHHDLEILRAIEPVTQKLAVASALRESFADRLASAPIDMGKKVINTVVGAPVRAPLAVARGGMSLADKALAALITAKQQGSMTPAMITAALSAGVAPAIVKQFANQ